MLIFEFIISYNKNTIICYFLGTMEFCGSRGRSE